MQALRAALVARVPASLPYVGLDGRPVVLHLLHGWGGGAARFVRDLAAADQARHHIVLRAESDSRRKLHGHALALLLDPAQAPVRHWPLAAATASTIATGEDYRAVLQGVIADWRVAGVVVDSLIGHSLDALRTGLPTAVVCHDYYPAWPQLHADFGAPDFDASDAGLLALLRRSGGDPLFPGRSPEAWVALRRAWLDALEAADATLIAPTRTVQANLCRLLPALAQRRWRCIPHGLEALQPLPRQGRRDASMLRVLVPGRINGGKGEDLLAELLPRLPDAVELVLLGAGRSGMRFFGHPRVHLLLDYAREDLAERIAGIAPDAALLPSTVAETFSYALSELWALRVPVIATALGSFAERIEPGRTGLLVAPQAGAVAALLQALAADRAPMSALDLDAAAAQVGGLEAMAAAHREALPLRAAAPTGSESDLLPLQRSLQAAEVLVQSQRSRLQSAERSLHALQAELERRADWAASLDRQLRARSAWAKSLESDLIEAQSAHAALQAEYDARSAWARSLESDLIEAQAAHAALQAEYDARSAWARSLESDLIEAQSAHAALQAEFDQRSAWAHALQAELEGAQAAHAALQTEFDERTRWALSMQDELMQVQRDFVALTERLEQRGAELAQAGESLRRIEAELAGERELSAAARRSHEAERAELQRYIDSLIAQRDAFEAERNLIVNSLSWKLTKPLRFARRLLRGALARVRYRLQRIAALRHRFSRSLKLRGVGGTVARIRREFEAPPTPSGELRVPAAQAFQPFALPRSETPRVSIVIPVYNHIEATLTCLRSIRDDADERFAFEVITVDDGSSDQTADWLPRIDGLRYVRNPQNLGFIGACNAGAAQARGEFVVFLNNDTAVQPGWLDALVETFDRHPRAGLVGAKLVYPDGRLQEAGGIVFADGSGWNYGRFDDPADPRYNYLREVDYCSGAAIALRKSLFDELGGFDSHYAPAYYEDTDLAMKVRARGLSVLYQPAAVVVHYEGVTSGTDTGSGVKAYQVVNQEKFLARWRDALATHAAPGTDIAIAREHRAGRRVLVIDATTPQPDQDSGSVRLCNILRLLRERGDAVTFFADNRAWVERYTADLQQMGVEVLWHPFLSDPLRWFAENGRRFDTVFVSRHYVASIYLPLVREHAPKARFVFDTVDLHYLREQRAAQLTGREDLASAAAETREKELRLIRESDVSVVVSPVEQELLAREAPGAQVEVLSNVHEIFGRRRGFEERRDLMFVGGFQHPPNIDAAEWFVREIWPMVRAELPDCRFHIIGSKATDQVRALGAAEGVVFHGYVEDIEPFLDGCRLALAPLRYGAGVKGKVNMSMSYGQPVVGTAVATEGMYIRPDLDVLVADEPAAFAAKVVRAYTDPALWLSLSDNGLANVARHFSFDSARQALQRVVG